MIQKHLVHLVMCVAVSFMLLIALAEADSARDWNWCVVDANRVQETIPTEAFLDLDVIPNEAVEPYIQTLDIRNQSALNSMLERLDRGLRPTQFSCLVFNRLSAVTAAGEQHVFFVVERLAPFRDQPELICSDFVAGTLPMPGRSYQAIEWFAASEPGPSIEVGLGPIGGYPPRDGQPARGIRFGLRAVRDEYRDELACRSEFQFVPVEDYLDQFDSREPQQHSVDHGLARRLLGFDR